MTQNRQAKVTAYLLITPLVLFVVLLLGYPFLADLYYSFTTVTFETLRSPQWSGFANYTEVLRDGAFWSALGFSARFAVAATLLEVLLGFAIALVLEPLIRQLKPLLALVLLPLMVAPVLMGIMYRLILNEFVGLIPLYLSQFGIYVNLLTPPWLVPTLITIEVLQWTPFAFLIFYTALQSIPHELVEAARIDGAAPRHIFRFVTLPLLIPATAIVAFIRFVDSFRVFDHIFVLTGGGPGTLTTSISIYIYNRFFQQGLIGEAVAASMLLLIFSLIPLYISMRYILRGSTT